MSEIDDIFSSNPKSKQTRKKKPSSTFKSVEESSSKKRPLVDTVVDTSVDLSGPSKRREKDSIPKSSSKKRPLPETVVDTSTDLPGLSKRRKKDSIPNKNGKSKKSEPTDFGDSRGSGGRRKTEEGWSVYKEAELGLNNEGGDTPLCPFDCNCCF